MTDARSPIRALRAAAFAAVCVTLAAIGHALASGPAGASAHAPAPGALWTAFAVTGVVAWLAAGRRRGAGSIGAGLLTVQALLHLILAGALPYGLSTSMSTAAHTGMDMSGTTTGADPAAVAAADGLLGGSAAMIAAHVLAALFCALWLARGEAALFRLGRAARALAFAPLRLLLATVRPPAAPRRPRPRAGAPVAHRLRGAVLAHALSRRGPPAGRTARATAPGAAALSTA
ncbi:hypothetical protein [Streptomyces paludis]|uniref:MFS transporter n=1 Tax=Streptomyces paludis TaxID=2282738 RepID=A0A345HLB1_9ACTN|nr:hypothetical protein [Streptomyces paludis]AXG77485.1 hypothetical protein DVK44_07005 [Streptomyces paludis]